MKNRQYHSRRNKQKLRVITTLSFIVIIGIILFSLVNGLLSAARSQETMIDIVLQDKKVSPKEVVGDFLTPNIYSRPQTELKKVNGIVVHYTANPGTDAKANRNYFEGLKNGTDKVFASSHYIIGLDGTVIQCIPLNEIAYASNTRNNDTISIECCHPSKDGKFSKDTYASLVALTAWLCGEYGLPIDAVIRHYDITGKECPKYYVKNNDKWITFKKDVQDYLNKNNINQKEPE